MIAMALEPLEVYAEAGMITTPTAKQLERFMAKIDMSGGPTACWPWLANRCLNGYGRVRIGDKLHGAHRVSLVWLGGREFREGACVLHACDNPGCANPRHLRYGTQRDNAQDRETRGRGNQRSGPEHSAMAKRIAKRGADHWTHKLPERLTRGVRHHQARLTDKQVVAICKSTESHAALGRRYGVAEESIAAIRRGDTWKHVKIEGPRDRRVGGHGDLRFGPRPQRRKLTDAQVRAIRASTETNVALGKRYSVSDVTISLIRRRLLCGETK